MKKDSEAHLFIFNACSTRRETLFILTFCMTNQADMNILSEFKMERCFSFRPDAQLFGGQEEEQLNRELPDDILRRQVINNLAKHVLFSKKSQLNFETFITWK